MAKKKKFCQELPRGLQGTFLINFCLFVITFEPETLESPSTPLNTRIAA